MFDELNANGRTRHKKPIQVDWLKDYEISGFVVSELVFGPGAQILNIKKISYEVAEAYSNIEEDGHKISFFKKCQKFLFLVPKMFKIHFYHFMRISLYLKSC